MRGAQKGHFIPATLIVLAIICCCPGPSSGSSWLKASFSGKDGGTLCTFQAELAVTPEEQSLGLMFRQSLDPDKGMLFIFEGDGPRSFWMRNTYIPLDLIFINSGNEVIHVHHSAKPKDETSILSGSPAQYVLEVKAGRAKACGIRKGTKLTIADTR